MSEQAKMICEMVDILPIEEQALAVEFIKRMIMAWDPDYTKVTEQEMIRIDHAENSGFLDEDEIDWNNLDEFL